jgi:sulfatase maturation enzyme AslB (radical SAM superfamily)
MSNEYEKYFYFHPEIDIVENKNKNQVALIKPLANSWIKISYSAFEYVKLLSEMTISSLIEIEFKKNRPDTFIKLLEYLIYNGYLIEKFRAQNPYFKIQDEYKKNCIDSFDGQKKMIYLSITDNCNLKCIHCYNTVNYSKKILASKDERIFKILDRLKYVKIADLVITGGEPFLRKDLFTILDKASEIAENISVTTNGLLINSKKINLLQNYANIQISVSLDGLNKQTHEFLRGKNTYNKTINVIKRLKKNNIRTHIISTINRLNYKELINFDSFIKDSWSHWKSKFLYSYWIWGATKRFIIIKTKKY